MSRSLPSSDSYDPFHDDTYQDGPYMVFTERFHVKRGSCCGQNCRHCPYEPKAKKGNRNLARAHEALSKFLKELPKKR